jgi:predicted nucleic acid-binding protein
VLRRAELRIPPADVDVMLELIRSVADSVAAVPLAVRLPDPNDTPFLEVAAASNSILVTGNARHYPRSSRAGVVVLAPREFIELIRSSQL